jgi:hypothetical protein
VPATVTVIAGSGLGAGPLRFAPVKALNVEPWHGQFSTAPPALTVQP